MVLQPNAHGLFGYLKDTCHIRHQLLVRPSGAQLIETALDLRQRQQKDRAQQVRLHFQCVVALIAGTERRVFAGPAELFLMEQPVPQLDASSSQREQSMRMVPPLTGRRS